MSERVSLLVGSRKGAFILDPSSPGERWKVRGPLCEGWPIHDVTRDPRSGAIFAAGGSTWYGPAVWRSDDRGATWMHSSAGLSYGDDGDGITTVWNVTPAGGSVYAGVEPAGLFRSDDAGQTWNHVAGLTNHPSRADWQPGNGGLCLHSIVPHPSDPDRMWVGISAVGVFATEDGGRSWESRNRGVRADFLPEPYPELGQCVHKLAMAAGDADTLYQQNHCGVYRSDDGGRSWDEITEGLPSQFGFPIVAHPRRPETAWVIPLNGDDRGRYVPDGRVGVWRTDDRGATWQRFGDGLPQADAFVGVLREAMAVAPLEPAGVYFGTSTGQLYGSRDEGRTWALLADHLPPIWSVDVALG